MLEELADAYGTTWTTTKMLVKQPPILIMLLIRLHSNIMTNEQKKEWFLRLNPNGVSTFALKRTKF